MSAIAAPQSNEHRKPERSYWRLPVVLTLLMALALVGIATWQAWPKSSRFYSDGQGLRVDENIAHVRDVLWRNPDLLPAEINIDGDDYEPDIDESSGKFYFVRGRTGEDANIYVAHRMPNGLSEPTALDGINTEYDDLGPRLTQDGLSLYFYSDRSGGFGGYDLWVAHRSSRDEVFGEPVNLGPKVNTSWDEYSPAPSPDGSKIYFSSNRREDDLRERPKPRWSATLRENRRRTGYDLYVASVTGAGYGEAVALAALNSSADDGTPAVSPNGDFVYFSSNRDGGSGGFDLYRARTSETGFGEIEWLGQSVNGPANELDPVLSMEGFELHFSSNRLADTGGAQPAEPTYDIYRTSSREVFVDSEMLQAQFDWAGWLGILGPALLALLLLLLLLLLSRMMLSATWRGRLSLIMRCLLASLFMHLLLLTLFMFWQVSNSISGLLDRDGGVRVALASPADDAGLTAQIRGRFVEDNVPTVKPEAFTRTVEHLVKPMPIAKSDARMPRIEVLQPTADTSESQVSDSQPTHRFKLVSHVAESIRPTQQISIAVANPSKFQRESESSRRLPRIDRPKTLRRNSSTLTTPQPQLTASIDRIALTQLNPSATVTEDTGPTPIKDATPSTVASNSVSSRDVNIPMNDRDDIVLPNSNPRDARVAEHESILPSENALMAKNHSRPGVAALPAPELAGSSVDAVDSKPINIQPVSFQSEVFTEQVTDARLTVRTSKRSIAFPISMDAAEFATPTVVSKDDAADAEVALKLNTGNILTKTRHPRMRLTSPTAVPLNHSMALPRSSPSIDLPGDEDSVDASTIRDATPIATTHTGRANIEMAAISTSEFELTPPAISIPKVKRTPPTNAIGGRVTDARSGDPIEGARVRLDLSENDTVTEVTDAHGDYALTIPNVPDHFAISTSFDGYVPASVDISKDAIRERSLTVNFKLRRIDLSTVALEAVPDVHHLGDDRFSGSVNSQFQKRSEGGTYEVEFELSELQLSPHMSQCELTMLTRGVQMPHAIYFNGRRSPLRIANSPRDGSFGLYRAEIDIRWLLPGENTFGIRARSRGNDIDDFEFVNVQLHFSP